MTTTDPFILDLRYSMGGSAQMPKGDDDDDDDENGDRPNIYVHGRFRPNAERR